jgi:predicted Holliday junction resolvase-like endonuclease
MIQGLILTVFLLILTISGGYVYIDMLLSDIKTNENKIERQKESYNLLKKTYEMDSKHCNQRVKYAEAKYKSDIEIEKDLTKKINKKENYEILASDKNITNCEFDGIGWVFPKK